MLDFYAVMQAVRQKLERLPVADAVLRHVAADALGMRPSPGLAGIVRFAGGIVPIG
jgi:hypothetical protein